MEQKKGFKSLHELLLKINTEQKAISYFVATRWPDGIECPFCLHKKVYRFSDKKRFKCAQCRQPFSYKSGTVYENTKVPMRKWIIAEYLVVNHKKGISSYQLATDIEVSQKTAWFMLHRIRELMKPLAITQKLDGIVQCDESWIGGKNKNRHKDKKAVYIKNEMPPDKSLVFGMYHLESKTVRAMVILNRSADTIQPLLVKNVKGDSTIMSDEWTGYVAVKDCYNHMPVNHMARRYVSDEGATTNSIENFWSQVKRTVMGTHHYISRKHLQRYINEMSFRFNARDYDANAKLQICYKNINGCRIKYKDLIALEYEAKTG